MVEKGLRSLGEKMHSPVWRKSARINTALREMPAPYFDKARGGWFVDEVREGQHGDLVRTGRSIPTRAPRNHPVE